MLVFSTTSHTTRETVAFVLIFWQLAWMALDGRLTFTFCAAIVSSSVALIFSIVRHATFIFVFSAAARTHNHNLLQSNTYLLGLEDDGTGTSTTAKAAGSGGGGGGGGAGNGMRDEWTFLKRTTRSLQSRFDLQAPIDPTYHPRLQLLLPSFALRVSTFIVLLFCFKHELEYFY